MVAGAGLPRSEPMVFNCQAGASGLQWEAGAIGPNQPWRCEAGGSASEAGAASSGRTPRKPPPIAAVRAARPETVSPK